MQRTHKINIAFYFFYEQKEFLKRELLAIEKTKEQCEKEANEKIRILTESYDASIEILLQK